MPNYITGSFAKNQWSIWAWVPNHIKPTRDIMVMENREAHAVVDAAFSVRGVEPYSLPLRLWIGMPNEARAATIRAGLGTGYLTYQAWGESSSDTYFLLQPSRKEAMNLDPAIREQAARATSVLVDGIRVDPWLVQVQLGASSPTGHPIELRLGIPILLFELKQSSVSVTASDVVRFVEKDIKDHPDNALTGYLVIARHVVKPLPAGSRSWSDRVFTRYQAPLPHPPKWKWTTVENVTRRDDDTLVIRGICIS